MSFAGGGLRDQPLRNFRNKIENHLSIRTDPARTPDRLNARPIDARTVCGALSRPSHPKLGKILAAAKKLAEFGSLTTQFFGIGRAAWVTREFELSKAQVLKFGNGSLRRTPAQRVL